MVHNIQAIEKAVMTTADEKMLKQMAKSMPYDIYQQLSPEARGKLSKVYGKEVPASSPYLGELPLKKQKEKIKLYVRMGPMQTGAGIHGFISVFEVPESDLEKERDFFETKLGLKTSLKTPDWGRGKLQEEL
ncbi:MAG: hypothetical protein PHZ02_01285 [Desulfocapsaceae bacterium]|nr:hypothetical protein [Desulfocapsaceae bacterium]